LLRHIIGNPFNSMQVPANLPATIISLAEALYASEPCAFALRDALLEAGHADFPEHFQVAEHPKGCAWLDAILGKA